MYGRLPYGRRPYGALSSTSSGVVVHNLTVSVSLADTVTVGRSAGKLLNISAPSSVSMVRSIAKIMAAISLGSAASLVRAVGRIITLAAASTATLVAPVALRPKLITVTRASAVTLLRQPTKIVTALQAQTAALARNIAKTLVFSSAPGAVLVRAVAKIVLPAPVAVLASSVRVSGKRIAVTQGEVATLNKMRAASLLLSSTAGSAVSLLRAVQKIINVSTSSSQEVSSSGAVSIPVPAGAISAQVEAIGTGGGTLDAGASGGAGAYSQTLATPLSGVTSLFVSIAAQAISGTEQPTKVSQNGSGGTVICLANGGHSGSFAGGPGAGGSTSGAVGDIAFAGGSGDGTDAGLDWAGGGAGGPNGNGGNAVGNTPGLGGGGKAGNGGLGNNVGNNFGGGAGSGGATGGVGWVKITWTFGPGVPVIATLGRAAGSHITVLQGSSFTLVRAISRSISAALAGVVSLIPIRTRPKTLSISSPLTATLLRTSDKVVAVATGSAVTLARSIARSVSVALGSAVSTRFAIGKVIAFGSAVVASLTEYRAFVRSIQVAQPSAVAMVRSIGKLVTAAVAQSVAMPRAIARTLAAGLAHAAVLVRGTSHTVVAATAPVASVARGVGHVAAVSQPSSISIGRAVAKIIKALQPQSVSVVKQQFRTMTFGLPHLVTVKLPIVRAAIIAVTQGHRASLVRRVGKLITAGIASVVTDIKRRLRSLGTTEPALVRAGNNIFLVTVQGDDGSGTKTLRFSTQGKMTIPSDTPANTYFEPRVVDPGNFERHLFSSGTTRGPVTVGTGDVVLASADSGHKGDTLDYLLGWAFDGYRIVIQTLTTVKQTVSLAKTLFTGSVEQLVTDNAYNQISLKIHDRLSDLNLPLLPNTFGGTTTAGGMGTADGNVDLAGQKKQRCWGTCFNVTAQVANAYDLVYLFSDGTVHSIVAYDGGVALTNDGDVANLAALLAWTQVPGHYKTSLALGLLRLGGSPAFGLTADVTEGATSAARTAAQIVDRMLLSFGISGGDIDGATVTALDAKNAAECGLLVTQNTTCLTAATQVVDSIGGYLVPDRNGVFQVGRFEAPSGAPVVSLDEDTIIGSSLQRIATGDDGRGIPTWRVTVNYGFNNTVQKDTQLAGAVTDARRVFLANQWRTAADSDASVQTRHKLAVDVTLNSCLAYESDAGTEATRCLTLHKVRRDAYRVGAMLDYGDAADLGSIVKLTSPRFGLGSGQLFVVIGRLDDYQNKQIQLDLWG